MPTTHAPVEMPRFNDLKGSCYYSLPLKPPFSITNLSCRLFPLRANLVALQGFCDNYVNIVPGEIAHFRASMPYLLLMMLDYGSMALEAANLGWFSQHEIMFCVPVEWYTVVKGTWVFQDWCMLTPFIFVDDDLSLAMGRTVAGWPKIHASMTPTLSAWMRDPGSRVNEATASTMVFPELYSGRKQEERPFLEIEREPMISSLQLPFDPTGPLAPWTIASNMMDSVARLGRDAMNLMSGVGILPVGPATNTGNLQRMMGGAARMMNPLRPNMRSNILNLKQFRSAEKPDEYCYQALTIGAMQFTSFNGMGLLGEDFMRVGDLSGGYRIKLHEWPSLPITRLLGLDVEHRWRGEGTNIAELKPVMPYWYDCNMTYATGFNVAWRSRDAVWHDRWGTPIQPAHGGGKADPLQLRYNSTLGPSAKPLAGPFRFSGTTARVLPLLCVKQALRTFVEQFFNASLVGTDECFELWGADDDQHAYVYATATSFGSVTSETNNVGDWADAELQFLIPVRRMKRNPDNTLTLIGVGMVPAYTFADNIVATLAGSEVMGIPTIGATFMEAESSWMSEQGPASDATQSLLRINAEVLPAVGEGERTQYRTLVEIVAGPPEDPTKIGWRNTGDRWSSLLREELRRKNVTKQAHLNDFNRARALSLEILASRVPLSLFTMKQFRDNADPDFACYQSIVRIHRTLYEVLDVREIEQTLTIRMHDYPTQSIVKTLGIIGKPWGDDGEGVSYAVQPVRPFWMRIVKDDALGQPLWYRAGSTEWKAPPIADGDAQQSREKRASFFDPRRSVGIGVDVVDAPDAGDPRLLVKASQDWKLAAERDGTAGEMSMDQARDVVRVIDPQMVVEAMLSREWNNFDKHTRWRAGRRALVDQYDRLLASSDVTTSLAAEQAFFKKILRTLGKRPGDQPVDYAQTMVGRLEQFTRYRMVTESTWAMILKATLERLYPDQTEAERADHLSGAWIIGEQGAEIPDALVDPAAQYTSSIQIFIDLLDSLRGIGALDVMGEPSSPDNPVAPGARDNQTRLKSLVCGLLQPIRNRLEAARSGGARDAAAYEQTMTAIWDTRDIFRESVVLARERCDLQREALFNVLSKAYQKPDFCVARDSAGPEADRLFPRDESWDDAWYAGPFSSISPAALKEDAGETATAAVAVETSGGGQPMTTTRGTALAALYGDVLFRSVTLALPVEQVRRLLPPGVQLGSQSVTPAGTHPVIVSFNVLSRVRTAIPTLLPTLDYNEYTLGIPHSYSTRGLASTQSPGPFYYMPLLLLDSFLAVLGGLMWWGYRKQSANFTMTDEYCAIASTDDEPVTSLRWTGDGPYMSVDECQNFTPIRAMLDQPLLSQLPVGLGPFPMMARFEKQWSVARIRPIEASLVVNRELAHGLPVGKHPETGRSPGIDSSVLGSYEYQSPFMLGVPYPVGAAR